MKSLGTYRFLLLGFIFLNASPSLYAQKDSSFRPFQYVRIGADLSKPLYNFFSPNQQSYEFQLDAALKKDVYTALEMGWGNARVNNDFLSFKSSNTFIRLGLDKTFFGREFKGDMDNAFAGLRLGFAPVKRGSAAYKIDDPVWGNGNGIIPSASFNAWWIELTGGFRMEIVKNVFAGWNVRGKTFLNPKKFESLPPSFIAGYGRGDKNTAFSYNFYVLYGIGKR
ncbi:MAG: hypothetical protein JNJ58_11280 [Chitinophagaceae bacterium]|nr:hypothetical protein [Chitinophagaceae bacterium]